MGALRRNHHANLIILTIAACILAPAATLGAPREAAYPRTNAVAPHSAASTPDDIGLIVQRLKVQFANPEDSRATRESNYPRAEGYAATMAADGHWPDLEYEGDWPAWNAHLSRLAQLASAYETPASPDNHSKKMLDGVERGLEYWVKNRQPLPHQWWQNTIGQPLQLSRVLVPLEDVLPAGAGRAQPCDFVRIRQAGPSRRR